MYLEKEENEAEENSSKFSSDKHAYLLYIPEEEEQMEAIQRVRNAQEEEEDAALAALLQAQEEEQILKALHGTSAAPTRTPSSPPLARPPAT